jgi:hypothetical protein
MGKNYAPEPEEISRGLVFERPELLPACPELRTETPGYPPMAGQTLLATGLLASGLAVDWTLMPVSRIPTYLANTLLSKRQLNAVQ